MTIATISPDTIKDKLSSSEMMLNGSIFTTLLRFALPIVIVSLLQVLARVYEIRCIGVLGTDILAGVTLVFPIIFLMNTLSNGGIGGGVSSSIARAIGANRIEDAEKLVFHTLLIAIGFGATFSFVMLLGGPLVYSFLGGTTENLKVALIYSNIIFIAAIPIWCVALLTAALRGMGDMKFTVYAILGECIASSILSPYLMSEWTSFNGIGIIGSAVAYVVFNFIILTFLIFRLRSTDKKVRLKLCKFDLDFIREILHVGSLSAIGTLQGSIALLLITGAVGHFGAYALAGYGLASRIDVLMIPVLFGFGTVVISMIGTAIGAGEQLRASNVAKTGMVIGFCLSSFVGILLSSYPHLWLSLFSDNNEIIKWGSDYLQIVAPFYGFFAIGLMLYFASQGFRHVGRQLIAGSARLLIAGVGCWLAVSVLHLGHIAAFKLIALGIITFGVLSIWLMKKQIFLVRE